MQLGGMVWEDAKKPELALRLWVCPRTNKEG